MIKEMQVLEAELSAAFASDWEADSTESQVRRADGTVRAIDTDLFPLGGSRPRRA